MIKELRLTNFRQFGDFKLKFNNDIIVIHGDNTKGKSTILEALFLITNGYSPWGDFDDEFNTTQNEVEKYFRIEIQNLDERDYVYYRDTAKRQLKLNGGNTTSKKFFENISSIMFSPEQIELLMISSSKRREFLDHIISQIDIEYNDIKSKYERSLKQRNAILKKLGKLFFEKSILNENDQQLIYWTKQIARYGAIIMAKRSETISKLKNEDIEIIYKPSVTLNLFEDLANVQSIEKIVYELLMEKIKRDIVTGYTNIGIHRDDWTIFSGKEIRRFGSRGEKRIAIGRLLFLSLELVSQKKGFRPILLLDDISSELDKGNTLKAMSLDTISRQQTFITTIEIEHVPKEILEIAQIIDLNNL